MPFRFRELPEHDLVITVPFGVITDAELPAYYRSRLASGSLHAGLRELVDGRQIEKFDVTARGQAALVEELRDHRDRLEGIRWGFIATSTVAFGMFRMFQAQKGDLPFEAAVFDTPAEVAAWLGVPEAAVRETPAATSD